MPCQTGQRNRVSTVFFLSNLVGPYLAEREQIAVVQEASQRTDFKIGSREDATMTWFLCPAWTQLSAGGTVRFTQSDTDSTQSKPAGCHTVRPDGCQHSHGRPVCISQRGKLSRQTKRLARLVKGSEALQALSFTTRSFFPFQKERRLLVVQEASRRTPF